MIAKYLIVVKSKVTIQSPAKLHKYISTFMVKNYMIYASMSYFSELPITSCFLCGLSALLLVVSAFFSSACSYSSYSVVGKLRLL